MENYIIEISKYYFKGVLNNPVIQKALTKKEEKFHIQEKVLNELEELKEFILEIYKLNFSRDSIQESIDSFIKDTEYLIKVQNLNIDLENILKNYNIENNDNAKKYIAEPLKTNHESNKIIQSNELKIIDNEKIEIIPDVMIDKYFEKNLFFEKICNLYLETSINMGTLVFQETSFEAIANGEFENKMNQSIRSLKNKLLNIIPTSMEISLLDSSFHEYSIFISTITEIAKEEKNNIFSDLSDLKTLQKLSRASETSLFVGNLYAIGAFAAFKGVKSIYNSISESNERNNFKNTRESNFMNMFYTYMEENLENYLFNTLPIVYNTIALNFLELFPNLSLKEFDEIMDSKLRFENDYKNIPDKVTKSDYKQIKYLLSLYPYSEKIWDKFFSVISIEQLFILENNLKINQFPHTLEKLLRIKNQKILLESNDLKLIYSTIKNSTMDSILIIFNERFYKKIDKEKIDFFIKILEYIFENYDISLIFSKKDILVINLIKENLNKNLETYFEKNKDDIFICIKDISKILEKNILLMYFFEAQDIIYYINEKYSIYNNSIAATEKENLTSIQNLINKDLDTIKSTTLSERNFMKYFLLFNYFKHNSFIKKMMDSTRNIKDEIIHLTWNTKNSIALVTLTTLFFKVKKIENKIYLMNINKVKIKDLSIELETNEKVYLIPIFDISESSTEKEESVKALALYIKKLSNYWKNNSIGLKIYVSNHFREIDNLFSNPSYSLEFIFDNNLRTQDIFRIFLKNGFVTNQDIILRKSFLEFIISNLKKYAKLSDKIQLYPFKQEEISILQDLSKELFNKFINSEILAVYFENENEEDKSIMVLTEKTLVIFTNSFGEIPLNIINNITLNGFSSHTLELKTNKGNFSCLLNTNNDSNKIFVNLIKEFLSLSHQ